jgi:hypothetical protein
MHLIEYIYYMVFISRAQIFKKIFQNQFIENIEGLLERKKN